MIKDITLKFGSSNSQSNFSTELTPITVFVGPNNSGKSKLLTEIEVFAKTGKFPNSNKILQDANLCQLNEIEGKIERHTLPPLINESLKPDEIIFGNTATRTQISLPVLLNWFSRPNEVKESLCRLYLKLNTISIFGSNRTNLVNQQSGGNLKDSPTNPLQVLFQNNTKRGEVRRVIYDAFKKYFVIDPTQLGNLSINLSDVPPIDEIQEKGIHDDAVDFHKNALNILDASDGVKAYAGIITTIIAGEPEVMLIDEPEAFLHPSLSFKLGKEIGNTYNTSGSKRLFTSSHSSNFLMGLIQSGAPINIIRLTYSNYTPTARILPNEKVLKLMRHPLLRSTGVLNGLFYEFVIVTEADSDRAFYQEINERLLTFEPNKGIPNCLFLNAQNKQTIHEILRPLRDMGIPCIAIVDVDIIKEGGQVWTKLLSSANVPKAIIESTNQLRTSLYAKIKEQNINLKTNGGVQLLNKTEKEECNHLFDQLNTYGIFPVRNGELESWLMFLEVAKGKHGTNWLIEIFEKLGEDPNSDSYVRPSHGDVWEFVFNIKQWFLDAERKGMPE